MASYLVNKSPRTSLQLNIPEEVWSGNHVDYPRFKVFGYPTYAHVNKGKLESGARKCIFLGYSAGVK